MKNVLCLIWVMASYGLVSGQSRWDGGAGDGRWLSALNWSDDKIPLAGDEVLLDNFFVSGSYEVFLPAGNSGVAVRSVIIEPGWSRTIALIIPSDNIAVPAFSAIGPGYGLVLGDGAVFRNSSGAASGSVVSFSDSVMIKNGGRYIHNTERAHAAVVTILSRASGTSNGVFEFDVPGATGYTVSGSGRNYGSLVLTSSGAGKSYVMSGSNPLTVRGNLEVRTGAGLSIDFSAPVNVYGDAVVNGTVDLAERTRLILRTGLGGGGIIRESGSGFPEIEMMGPVMQDIHFAGQLLGDISFKINNASGVSLSEPVRIAYRLILEKGRLFTSPSAMLIMDTAALFVCDSNAAGNFVDGPLRVIGLADTSYLRVPVGKGSSQRWLAFKSTVGSFEIEFFRSNPNLLSNDVGPGLHHISGIEYWRVVPLTAWQGFVELSFDNVNSGGVTSVTHLAVAALTGSPVWKNAGNTAATGSAGFRGSVTGGLLHLGDTAWLTLASTDSMHNLLPEIRRYPDKVRKKPQANFQISVYPTVIESDMITLEINVAKAANYTVVVSDLVGRVYFKSIVRVGVNREKIYLGLPRLIPGNYLLSVANKNNETLTQRFFRK